MKKLFLIWSCVLCLVSCVLTVKPQTSCPNVFICGSNFVDPRDGYSYPTVKIGTQCWMTKNLEETKYANGDAIPNVTSGWASLTTGMWCYYSNASGNGTTYGLLYNWYAVKDGRGLCPQGWYVPSLTEWTILGDLDGQGGTVEGCALKVTGSTYWGSSNTCATDSTGFSALPGGYLSGSVFVNMGSNAYFWASSTSTLTTGNYIELFSNSGYMALGGYNAARTYGMSVRCVRDN